MKSLLTVVAITLGLSVSAFACPDLSGEYVCGQEELVVDTFELNGTHYIEFNGNGGLPADNKWVNLPDSETEKNAKIRLTCGTSNTYGDHFLLDYEADVYDKGQYLAFLDSEVFFYVDSDTFVQKVVGKAKGSWGEQPIDEETICTKK